MPSAPPAMSVSIEKIQHLYRKVRNQSAAICQPLETEDYVVQPTAFVSPPKWHLGHTTWFFEQFILIPWLPGYKVFNDQFAYAFNSYYEAAGKRIVRSDRGNMSRPTVDEVYAYRKYIDEQMELLFQQELPSQRLLYLLEVGCNHEQQHQELLLTDIKYILGHNPMMPAYTTRPLDKHVPDDPGQWLQIPKGLYHIGSDGPAFHYDNESKQHQVFLGDFEIFSRCVTNEEYLQFIEDGGYQNHKYWHSEGWEWVKKEHIRSPLYWHQVGSGWKQYTLAGLIDLDPEKLLAHISYYEAFAFAEWKGLRLPTEQEWEVAADHFTWGKRWEWTASAYMPYPGFEKEEGALGEYNGKFMVNQQVLRGASVATPEGHSRKTYRNFFHANERWQYTGIRLVKK